MAEIGQGVLGKRDWGKEPAGKKRQNWDRERLEGTEAAVSAISGAQSHPQPEQDSALSVFIPLSASNCETP